MRALSKTLTLNDATELWKRGRSLFVISNIFRNNVFEQSGKIVRGILWELTGQIVN